LKFDGGVKVIVLPFNTTAPFTGLPDRRHGDVCALLVGRTAAVVRVRIRLPEVSAMSSAVVLLSARRSADSFAATTASTRSRCPSPAPRVADPQGRRSACR